MSENLQNNSRVAKNTLYLYFRTLFVMAITIFTSRVILDALGVEDYGIYSVVGGFVSMFSLLSGTLTAASQRFIAFELGKRESNVGRIFSATVSIHILLAIIVLVLLETIGLWFVNCKMNISEGRMFAANIVFQCSVVTFCVNLISIPYNAAIVAYEKMSAFAYIGIFEAVSKLVAVCLLFTIGYDSLIVYAFFMLLIAVILRLVYGIYCHKKFEECRFYLNFDRSLFREMLSFSGWNFIGSTASVLNGQGINMLINLFFGVTLNAARGLATQVDNAINTFVQNFMMALNPQMIKNFAAGNYEYVNKVIIVGTKFAFFLFWIVSMPIFFNVDFILSVWLNHVPEYTGLFVKLGILYALCQNLSQCLYTAMLATGKIKKYQIVVGGLSILAFPLTWIFFKFGLPGEWGYWSMIIFSIICLIARVVILREMIPLFSVKNFVLRVIVPVCAASIPSFLMIRKIHMLLNCDGWMPFVVESLLSFVISCVFIVLLGSTKSERAFVVDRLKNKIRRKA